MKFAQFYALNANAFLASRGIYMEELEDLVTKQYSDIVNVLLTSSAVHGIANRNSDIDLICVRDNDSIDASMATQIHFGENHAEVISFNTHQIALAGDLLDKSLSLDVTERLLSLRRIEEKTGISRKYLERIFSGVDSKNSVPYLAYQAPLSSLWALDACDMSYQSAQYLALAINSGEFRAASGYAANALQYLMSAILADAGWPMLNRKWILTRWRAAPNILTDSSLFYKYRSDVDELWAKTGARLDTTITEETARHTASLIEECAAAIFGEIGCERPRPSLDSVRALEFLPGAMLLVNEAAGLSTFVRDTEVALPIPPSPSALFGLGGAQSAFWLSAVRSKMTSFSLA